MKSRKVIDEGVEITGEMNNYEVPATRTSKSPCRKCGGLTHIVKKRLYCARCGYQDGYR